jgi:ABC-type uncharacterized transport system substrate-binding protein
MPGKIVCTLACLALPATQAAAHPHVWIEARSDVVFNDAGEIIAINHEWTMDEMYSATAVEGLDGNGDGDYSPTELAPLTRENIASLKEFSYFTHVMVDGKTMGFGEIVESGQRWSNKRLKLHFQLPLAAPVNPLTSQVYYQVYDPEFFIAIEFSGADAITALGAKPQSCRIDLRQPAADQQTDDTRAMLATKGVEWKPAPEENFGAMFAQPITVACR